MLKSFKILAPLLAAAAVAACGGAGGGGMSSTFSGKIIDGYIANAVVCVDLDSSLTCDANEPSTRTLADGSYILPYTGINPVGLPILAVVAPDSKDSDDGGLTLAEAGKSAFNLASPILNSETAEVLVTPLTTMIMHNVMAGSGGAVTEESILASQTQVKKQLGVTKDILGLDITKDAQLHQMAQVISIVLGDITQAANSKGKSAQLEAGTALVQSILPVIFENGAMNADVSSALASTDRKQIVANLKTALDIKVDYTNSVIAGSINNIAVGNKLPGQQASDIQQMLAAGFGVIERASFHIYDASQELGIGPFIDEKHLRVNFEKIDISNGQSERVERHWYAPIGAQSRWVRGSEWSDNYHLKSDGTWILRQHGIERSSTAPKVDGNCITVQGADSTTGGQINCIAQVNVSGKKVADLLTEVCSTRPGVLSTPASCASATFADGSLGYNITVTPLNDTYTVDVPRRASNAQYHAGNSWGDSPEATTIPLFIAQMLSKPHDLSYKINVWNQFNLKFISFDDATGTGVVNWYFDQEPQSSGTGKFYLKTVKGQKILVLPPVARYHKENPGEMVGQDFFFAAVNDKIRVGAVEYANTKTSLKFGGYTTIGNQKALDSILNAMGLAAFPYDQATVIAPLR